MNMNIYFHRNCLIMELLEPFGNIPNPDCRIEVEQDGTVYLYDNHKLIQYDSIYEAMEDAKQRWE